MSLRLDGAGEFVSWAHIAGVPPQCLRAHGYEVEGEGFELRVPPLSEAAIVATYAPPLLPPWPSTDLAFTFRVDRFDGSELEDIRSPSPRLEGPRGIRLHLRLRAGARSATSIPAPAVLNVGPGEVVNVNGTADPLPSRVALRLRPRDPIGRTRTIARPRLRPTGGFFARIRAPRHTGLYEVYAAAPGDRSRQLLGDASCGRLLQVR